MGVEEAVGRWVAETSEVSTAPAVTRSSHQQADSSRFERLEGKSTFCGDGKGESREIKVRTGGEAAEIWDDTIIDT